MSDNAKQLHMSVSFQTTNVSFQPTLVTNHPEVGTHAAFLVKVRLDLSKKTPLREEVQQTNERIVSQLDLFHFVQITVDHLIAGASVSSDDTDGAKKLRELGIPSRYARNLEEFQEFLSLGCPTVVDVVSNGVTLIYGPHRTYAQPGPSSEYLPTITYRWGPRPFERVVSGNYRDTEVVYGPPRAPDFINAREFVATDFLYSRLNTEKGSMSIALAPTAYNVMLFSHGFIEVEFKVLDARDFSR